MLAILGNLPGYLWEMLATLEYWETYQVICGSCWQLWNIGKPASDTGNSYVKSPRFTTFGYCLIISYHKEVCSDTIYQDNYLVPYLPVITYFFKEGRDYYLSSLTGSCLSENPIAITRQIIWETVPSQVMLDFCVTLSVLLYSLTVDY